MRRALDGRLPAALVERLAEGFLEAGYRTAAFVSAYPASERFGLDQPLPVQLWRYMSGVLQLDFGYSYRQQMPVLDLILDRLPATLLLTGAAFVISLSLGILAGTLAAMRA